MAWPCLPRSKPAFADTSRALAVTRTRGLPLRRLGATVQGVRPLDGDHLWTVEELERLTPHDRRRLLDERVVTDLSSLVPDLVERIRHRGRVLMERRGTASRTVEGG